QGGRERCLENVSSYLLGDNGPRAQNASFFEKQAREIRILAGELPLGNRAIRETAYRLILDQLDQAIKLGAQSPGLYFEVGAAEERLADVVSRARPKEAFARLKAALAAYSKGLELDPKNVKLLVKRGW